MLQRKLSYRHDNRLSFFNIKTIFARLSEHKRIIYSELQDLYFHADKLLQFWMTLKFMNVYLMPQQFSNRKVSEEIYFNHKLITSEAYTFSIKPDPKIPRNRFLNPTANISYHSGISLSFLVSFHTYDQYSLLLISLTIFW